MGHNRYLLRKEARQETWSIIDVFTGFPAEVDNLIMSGMEIDEAEDLIELMNNLDRQRRDRS